MADRNVTVRLPADLVADLDALVRDGLFVSRTAALRAAVRAITGVKPRGSPDEALIAGYMQKPQTPAEMASALESLRSAIAEEPW